MALADWWCAVLGYEVLDRDDAGGIEIGPPGQQSLVLDHADVNSNEITSTGRPVEWQPTLMFVPVSDPTPGKLRLHLDVNATDRDQAAELERLLRLGATRADAGQTGEESWQVLEDPEGNEFCLLASRVAPLGLR